MKYLKIQNKGLLDYRLVALMGGTTKSNNIHKIGQFGSGLKYSLAYLLRNKVDFKIFIGTEEVTITTEVETIKNEDFHIICINGQRTSITTKMGMDWQPWMIVREVYCNALDEGGALVDQDIDADRDVTGEEGKTTFYIERTPEFQDVINAWEKYFIPLDMKPIFENDFCSLYEPGPHLCLYKNGVLIHESDKLKSVFRYNFKDVAINELRQYQGSMSWDITKVVKSMDLSTITYFLEHVKGTYEASPACDYNWFEHWGDGWKSLVETTNLITSKLQDRFYSEGYSTNDLLVVPEHIFKSLNKEFEEKFGEFSIKRSSNDVGTCYPVVDQELDEKLQKCLNVLIEAGYPVNKKWKFIPSICSGESNFYPKDWTNNIFVNVEIKKLSTADLLKALIKQMDMLNFNIPQEVEKITDHFVSRYSKLVLDGALLKTV